VSIETKLFELLNYAFWGNGTHPRLIIENASRCFNVFRDER